MPASTQPAQPPTDEAVAAMNLAERVTLLQRNGYTDDQVFTALVDPDDPGLLQFIRTALNPSTGVLDV